MRSSMLLLAAVSVLSASAAQAQITVTVPPTLTVTEGEAASITVIKKGRGRALFDYVTVGQSATSGSDFTPLNGRLAPAGSSTFNIPTHDDGEHEGPETLIFKITSASHKTTVLNGQTVVTILDNDAATPPPPPPPVECPDGSTIPAGETCPTPPPPPATGWEPSPSLSGLVPIPSNFDQAAGLVQTSLPNSAAPDVMGAFRFICNAGQLRYDDPIVYPGQPGKSHLHQFYGNTEADANSTYSSLRLTGQGTCGYPFNRSAYWMPAMLDGNGNVVRPDFVSIYYKRRPKTDPVCSGEPGTFVSVNGVSKVVQGKCVNLPNGLKFIFGYDLLTGKAPTGKLWFACQKNNATIGGKAYSLEEAETFCPVGAQLGAIIEAPDCWDGKNLDAPNHRDHVAYGSYGDYGFTCPKTHPYVIPTFTLGAWFTKTDGQWRLSSDAMVPNLPRGKTFHADFWMAWDPAVHLMWEDNCLDKLLNCSAGDLGNGLQIRDAWIRADTRPKVVPLSSMPVGAN